MDWKWLLYAILRSSRWMREGKETERGRESSNQQCKYVQRKLLNYQQCDTHNKWLPTNYHRSHLFRFTFYISWYSCVFILFTFSANRNGWMIRQIVGPKILCMILYWQIKKRNEYCVNHLSRRYCVEKFECQI